MASNFEPRSEVQDVMIIMNHRFFADQGAEQRKQAAQQTREKHDRVHQQAPERVVHLVQAPPDGGMGYPSKSNYCNLVQIHGAGGAGPITEAAAALEIESIIIAIRKRSPAQYEVAFLFYLAGWGDDGEAHRSGVDLQRGDSL